ncbi:hypothetical protein HPP92_019460 [Vanilla planifolia]|uniref:Uncharacterized protein n=1 Tax=Vanilla planifolia TaxID=51239 RepID=A0A835UL53_VANPL|nr:hypothetical protein HPP92_019460 [Vanilla planifolia]
MVESPTPSSPQSACDPSLLPADGDAAAASSMASIPLQGACPNLEQSELKPELVDGFLDAWITENAEKLKNYEAVYARRLKAKYFSKKTLNGVDIFDRETRVDNVMIKSSRWPCTRSFAYPIHNIVHIGQMQSSTEEEAPSAPNKDQDQIMTIC